MLIRVYVLVVNSLLLLVLAIACDSGSQIISSPQLGAALPATSLQEGRFEDTTDAWHNCATQVGYVVTNVTPFGTMAIG